MNSVGAVFGSGHGITIVVAMAITIAMTIIIAIVEMIMLGRSLSCNPLLGRKHSNRQSSVRGNLGEKRAFGPMRIAPLRA